MAASVVNPSYNLGLQRGGQSSSMLNKLVSGSSFLMEGVRNLVFKRQVISFIPYPFNFNMSNNFFLISWFINFQNLPLTKITLDLMEGREVEDNFRYFDPKQLKQSSTKPTQPLAFNECIVFVVGGGNYIEYQNMMDCFRKKDVGGGGVGGGISNSGMGGPSGGPTKRIIYGASCLYNGSEFLEQLARLGREMK